MNLRTTLITALAVITLLGAGLYIYLSTETPVELVKVYEIPDSTSPQIMDMLLESKVSTQDDRLDSRSAISEPTQDLSQSQQSEAEQRRVQELEKSIAQKQLLIDELKADKAAIEAKKAAGQAMLAEAKEIADWITDWAARTEPIYAEVAFIMLDPNMNDQEDFKKMFPDLDERAYYADKLVEAEKATDQFAKRLALISEPLRSKVLDGIKAKWASTAGKDAIDAFIEQVNDKI